MNGKQQIRSISGQYPDQALDKVLQAIALILLGVLAITLHARLRYPLSLPGHHGMEFMAILVAGRMLSNLKYAGSFTSLGTGLILLFPIFGFKDPFMGFNFMLPGLVIDAAYLVVRNNKYLPYFLAFFSAVAYASIPISRIVLQDFSGYVYPNLQKYGTPLYPLFSHAFFGLIGGFAGIGISFIIKPKKRVS